MMTASGMVKLKWITFPVLLVHALCLALVFSTKVSCAEIIIFDHRFIFGTLDMSVWTNSLYVCDHLDGSARKACCSVTHYRNEGLVYFSPMPYLYLGRSGSVVLYVYAGFMKWVTRLICFQFCLQLMAYLCNCSKK